MATPDSCPEPFAEAQPPLRSGASRAGWSLALLLSTLAHAGLIGWLSLKQPSGDDRPAAPLLVELQQAGPPAAGEALTREPAPPHQLPPAAPKQAVSKPQTRRPSTLASQEPGPSPATTELASSKVKPVPADAASNSSPSAARIAASADPSATGSQSKGSATGGGDQPALYRSAYLHNPPPAYPERSREAGEEGRVVVLVLVSAQGLPKAVDIKQGSRFRRLDRAAVEAVRQWRFVPAKRGGEAVESTLEIPLTFSLRDAAAQ
ncbi:energy transducer TonB [uncultured Aquitalea sp.]|uniref:energy transducer TonB n=1 Tax=uncultured Aquitalea sp. TaxID=540272 RepID=UPI0025EA7B11|nr:energy transducer TonB [uncultured Aquitalea sp.]